MSESTPDPGTIGTDPTSDSYTGGPDPSSHGHELSGWGSDEHVPHLSPDQARRLQEHDEPVAAADFGGPLSGVVDDEHAGGGDADLDGELPPSLTEPDVSLGHEGGSRYRDAAPAPDPGGAG